jgi:tRNA-Thr(GGU) m(6)t(6)A37 methyltransferase TsaA
MNKQLKIVYEPIGIIHTLHKEQEKTPIQPAYASGIKGIVELYTEYLDGLKDLNKFSHIILLYHFHQAKKVKLHVKPYLEDVERGIFSTRAPFRPNQLGLSIVKLDYIENNMIHVENIDILDGTPLLDIKPYIFRFDRIEEVKSGWQDNISEDIARKRGKRGYEG